MFTCYSRLSYLSLHFLLIWCSLCQCQVLNISFQLFQFGIKKDGLKKSVDRDTYRISNFYKFNNDRTQPNNLLMFTCYSRLSYLSLHFLLIWCSLCQCQVLNIHVNISFQLQIGRFKELSFNNIYCLLCNEGNAPSPIPCAEDRQRDGLFYSRAFYSLIQLDFDTSITRKTVDTHSDCPADALYDDFTVSWWT